MVGLAAGEGDVRARQFYMSADLGPTTLRCNVTSTRDIARAVAEVLRRTDGTGWRISITPHIGMDEPLGPEWQEAHGPTLTVMHKGPAT